eukprot:428165-Prymnesium_polylepis.1
MHAWLAAGALCGRSRSVSVPNAEPYRQQLNCSFCFLFGVSCGRTVGPGGGRYPTRYEQAPLRQYMRRSLATEPLPKRGVCLSLRSPFANRHQLELTLGQRL